MNFVLKNLKDIIRVGRIANVHFFEFPEQYETHKDRHPFYELVFVAAGKLQINSEDYTGLLHKDEMIIHRPNMIHSLYVPSSIRPTVIIIGFECEGAPLEEFSSRPVKLGELEQNGLANIIKEGRSIFAPPYDVPTYNMKKKSTQPYGAEQILRIRLELFLIELVRKYIDRKELGDLPTSPTVHEIIGYVDENFLEKVTIDELAFMFCTNRSTLCNEFKRATGLTLLSYIANKKIEFAKEKVGGSKLTFTEIAAQMNFDSVHNFTRFFKKMTGVPPREFRKHAPSPSN